MNVILVIKKNQPGADRLISIFNRLKLRYSSGKVVFSVIDPDTTPDATHRFAVTELPQITFVANDKIVQVISPANEVTENTIVDSLEQHGIEREDLPLFESYVIWLKNNANKWMWAVICSLIIAGIAIFFFTRKKRKNGR